MGCRLGLLVVMQGVLVLDNIELKGHDAAVYCVRFSRDGKRIYSGGGDGTIRVWDPETKQQVGVYDAGRRAVHRMAFTADRKRIYIGDRGGDLGWIDVARERIDRTWRGHDGWVSAVLVRKDGKQLLTAASDKTIKFWDLGSEPPVLQFTGNHDRRVLCAAYSPDGRQAASCDGGGEVKLWDAATGRELRSFRAHNDWAGGVAYSPDGKRLATCGTNLKVWELGRPEPLFTAKFGKRLQAVCFSPDGLYVAAGGLDDFVRVWNVADGKRIADLLIEVQSKRDQGVYDMRFRPTEGQLRLAVAHIDRVVRVWTERP